jgi:Cu/Ag efflux protein CusF
MRGNKIRAIVLFRTGLIIHRIQVQEVGVLPILAADPFAKEIGVHAEAKETRMMQTFGIIAMLGAIITVGCSHGQRNDQPESAESDAQIYVIRGQVISVPQAGKPGTQFIVKHEPIDNFRDASGRIVGMDTMGMPFTPGEGVSLEEIRPGDKVEMRWVLQWKPEAKEYVESMRKLPAETQLKFGKAHTPTQ